MEHHPLHVPVGQYQHPQQTAEEWQAGYAHHLATGSPAERSARLAGMALAVKQALEAPGASQGLRGRLELEGFFAKGLVTLVRSEPMTLPAPYRIILR